MADQDKLYRCRVITPERVLFDGETDFVVFRAEDGDVGVLAGHEPLTTVMGSGIMRIFSGENEYTFAVFGGFAEMGKDGNLVILSDDARKPDEVDPERVRNELAVAQREQLAAKGHSEAHKAALAIRRAQVQLEVSTFPIIRGRHGGGGE